MFNTPDPAWKTNPDIVADESAAERYVWDDEEEEEVRFREAQRFEQGDEVTVLWADVPYIGTVFNPLIDDYYYVLVREIHFPIMVHESAMKPTGRHFELPLEVNE